MPNFIIFSFRTRITSVMKQSLKHSRSTNYFDCFVACILVPYVMRCNFTKSDTPPWVFFTFFNLQKWYQIAQNIAYALQISYSQILDRFLISTTFRGAALVRDCCQTEALSLLQEIRYSNPYFFHLVNYSFTNQTK